MEHYLRRKFRMRRGRTDRVFSPRLAAFLLLPWASRGRSRPWIAPAELWDGTAASRPSPDNTTHTSGIFLPLLNSAPAFPPVQITLVKSGPLQGKALTVGYHWWPESTLLHMVLSSIPKLGLLPLAEDPLQVSFPKSFPTTLYSTQNPFPSPDNILTFSRDGVNISFLVKFSRGSSCPVLIPLQELPPVWTGHAQQWHGEVVHGPAPHRWVSCQFTHLLIH